MAFGSRLEIDLNSLARSLIKCGVSTFRSARPILRWRRSWSKLHERSSSSERLFSYLAMPLSRLVHR